MAALRHPTMLQGVAPAAVGGHSGCWTRRSKVVARSRRALMSDVSREEP